METDQSFLPTIMMNEKLLSFTSKLIKGCPVQGQAENQSIDAASFVLFGINSNMATHPLLKTSALPAIIRFANADKVILELQGPSS